MRKHPSIFADKKTFGIPGNLTDNVKVIKRLAKAGFGNLKIGKHGLSTVYNTMYDKVGYKTMRVLTQYGYDSVFGLAF